VPGKPSELNGFVLSLNPSSDQFQRIQIFDGAQGLTSALFRISSKSAKAHGSPDLFDEVECVVSCVEQQRSIPFIKELRQVRSFRFLARSPAVFLAASEIGRFYLNNGEHLLDPLPRLLLLRNALESFSRALLPKVVLLKLYFCFSRDEGLAVHESWLSGLTSELRAVAENCLARPVDRTHTNPSQVTLLLDSLKTWMNEETELRCD